MWLLCPRIVCCVFVAVFVLLQGTLSAQDWKHSVGTTIDLVGGGTNRLTGTLLSSRQNPQSLFFYYGAYPSIRIASTGPRGSVLNASYAFGLNRTETDEKLHSNSHSVSLGYSSLVSQKLTISVSDTFDLSDDVATFNAFRSVEPSTQDFRFVFNPVAARVVTRNNSASVVADYTLTDKSGVSVSASHALRNYDGTGLGGLSDQQRASGGISYKRKTGRVEAWSVGYTASYFDFDEFQNSFSQTGHVGYTTELARDLGLQLSVGVSQVQNFVSRDSYIGYNTSAFLQKRIQMNSFSAFYTQTAGESSGLGSISDTRNVGFFVGRSGRTSWLFVGISAFDTRARLDNTLSTKGVQGSATLGIRLTPTVSIQGGVEYQHYDQSTLYGFDQKRGFLSLRYENPTLFRFAR